MLRGLPVSLAAVQLEKELRRAALPIGKLLASAAANAEQNFHLVPSNLFVREILVNEGKKLKRWMPRAQGRATPIWRRMSQVRIVLEERVSGMRSEAVPADRSNKKMAPSSRKRSTPSRIGGREGNEKGQKSQGPMGKARSLFQRKSV